MNPFLSMFSAFRHLAEQARRLGDALGSLADQVEQRQLAVEDPGDVLEHEPPPLPNGRKTTLKSK